MVLAALLFATGQASAFEYVSVPLARFGRGSYPGTMLMSAAGDVCFSTYGSSSAAYLWHPSDSTPTEIAASVAGTYYGCSAISTSGYVVLYESSSTGTTSALYDAYTDDLVDLTISDSTYAYGYFVNDNGYVAGYAASSDGRGYRAAWWSPEGGEGQTFGGSAYSYVYPAGIDNLNRVLITGYNSSRFGSTTDILLYDIDRDATYAFGAETPRYAYPVWAEDGDVVVYGGGGGPTLKYDFDTDDLDLVAADPFSSTYVTATNAAGQVVLTSYSRSGEYASYCWDEAHGATQLEAGGMTYTYSVAMNDAGQVVGYGYNADGVLQSYVWECTTGEATEIPNPGATLYSYASGITEDGVVLLYAMRDTRSRGYSVWAYDPASGQADRLTGDDTTSAYMYGYSQETGDVLVLDSERGHSTVRVFHRTE